MIPRVDMFCLPSEMKPADIVREVARGRYERVPVYSDDRDNIIGILRARDLLKDTLNGCASTVEEKLLIRPYFVPQSKTINGLLNDFRENQHRSPLWWMNTAVWPDWCPLKIFWSIV